jgi:hypothetical protein
MFIVTGLADLPVDDSRISSEMLEDSGPRQTFKGRRNRFRGIDSASLCSLAGQYDKEGCPTGPPDGNRFLGSLKGLQIRALYIGTRFSYVNSMRRRSSGEA